MARWWTDIVTNSEAPPRLAPASHARSPHISSKRYCVVGVAEPGLRRRLVLDRRRERLDQDGLLRLSSVLDLADLELNLLTEPIVAFHPVRTREHAAVGGVQR